MKKIVAKQVKKVICPLDKLNLYIWQGLESNTYSLRVEKQGSHEEIFVNLQLTIANEPLNFFDKRVYLAICALYNAGNECMTAGMIYRTMGGKGYPNQKKFEKIKSSIKKMMGTVISISNKAESEKYKYPYFHERGANLISCKYEETVEVKGGKTEFCLYLFEKPLMMRYAEAHKQVTTYTLEQFWMPLSMTEMNCAIDDYLHTRIARCSAKTLKIKHETLYEYCHFDTRKRKFHAREQLPYFLDFYMKLGLIHGYSLESNAILITI